MVHASVGAYRDQKRVSDPLELGLQMVVNHTMEVARELNLEPLEKQKALLTAILESTKGEKTKQSKNQPQCISGK